MALLDKRIEKSVRVLKLAAEMSREYYGQPMIICYSGGKDSDVLLHLAETYLGKDDFEVLNSHTTLDAPETVYHIRRVFDRLIGGVLRPGLITKRIKTEKLLRCGA